MDDDLTASHWDDVLSPSTQFTSSTAIPAHLGNQFADLTMDDPHRSYDHPDSSEQQDKSESEEEEEEEEHADQFGATEDPLHSGFGTSLAQQNQATLDQLHDLRKEERKEQKSALMSELTEGSTFDNLEASLATPSKIAPSDSLFGDKGKSITESNASESAHAESLSSPKKISQLKNSQFKAQRVRRYPSSTVVKQLKQGTQEPADPLSAMAAKPATEEPATPYNPQERSNELVRKSEAPLFDIKQASTGENQELTSKPLRSSSSKSRKRKSASLTEISVGNPVKVGDITTAHIVYSIESRNVQILPTEGHQENRFTVTRRYRDFCWLYKQLQISHPGRIIPPPPSKKTYIGRFNENFIENRRLSLEKMLQKISKVPAFNNDLSFVIFLTSENFANDSKERERTAPMSEESGDIESDVASTVSVVTGTGTSGGFMSSLFSIPTKLPEPDSFFSKKKAYIDDLEHNLRTFHRSLELIASQRIEIVSITEEIATIIDELANLEITKTTSLLLKAFAEVHVKLKESLDRINLQDQLTLGLTIEEYLRIIGSVKYVFETRTKTYNQYHTFKQDLEKKEEALNKLNNKYRSSTEKLNMLKFEVDSLKKKTEHFEKSFNTISETIKEELENFELERVDDFRNSVEIFIESSIESQKEAIESWETFYERQHLDQV